MVKRTTLRGISGEITVYEIHPVHSRPMPATKSSSSTTVRYVSFASTRLHLRPSGI